MSEHPKVFISYSHQNVEYENKILEFANRLRSEGIDANIDLYEEAPAEGWPRWMENQINNSDFVLVANSKSYYEKCYSDNKGKGISWEVNIVYQHIYDASTINTKFIPVFSRRKKNSTY
ncbi:MAG: toll/interleukin-1 receptor domain-containing protein [Anaerostipes hadrus]